ncbi:beta-lactamase hydrolase domain-containing protein [Aporhodopirellula aestuarii]|uniref:Protein tyrosine phosphatase family protein n=1 Tax=Aporhodopirellula aestuarii TaxID=2950107 RepID=A0ABT0U634_9BACT|nr:protein tyrosine phosphatase family protein [Aporhodopirellula aestuarii]MCM2372129.1 protein tyrosine phosphatase family protein [Aporhodopirellula aestuarii]
MPIQMKLSDDVTVGRQPSESEIQSMAADGFQSIINFRTAGEDEQDLSPDAEGEQVKSLDMEYLHIPVSLDSLDASQVDAFREQYKALPKPAFAHCKSGKRAGAMLMMHTAVENGMSGDQALKQASEMGFECDVPELQNFVRDYVNSRSNRTT